MMLEYLFFPKEMRNAISKLRAEGMLNLHAIEHLHQNCYKIIAVLIFGLIALFIGGLDLASGVVLMVFIIAGLQIEARIILQPRLIKPYLYGRLEEVNVSRVVQYSGFIGKIKIECTTRTGEKVVIGPIYGPILKKADIPKSGQVMLAYIHEGHAMPNLIYVKERFSLRKF